MGGGLIQLVALGAQDVYLTGNPQITFFITIYKKHTNFAKECIEQPLDGSELGRKSCTISRNADLIQEMYLKSKVTLTSGGDYEKPELLDATNLIQEVELQIGGIRIDKHYSYWLDIYNELFEKNHNTRIALTTLPAPESGTSNQGFVYIPLRFWFNRNPGLALPLISLQYHDVSLIFTLSNTELKSKVSHNTNSTTTILSCSSNTASNTNIKADITDSKLLVNYIYLDTNERRTFAKNDREYLVDQVQFTGTENKPKFLLTFNHPIKSLFWKIESTQNTTTNNLSLPITTIDLKLNGHDRFGYQEPNYFHLVQPYETNLGNGFSMNNTSREWEYKINKVSKNNNISLYSFALKPADYQPSGSCNFSRIDRAEITFTDFDTVNDTIHMFALNYNIFRIVSGLGGLVYSN